jgi:hypothetical protein
MTDGHIDQTTDVRGPGGSWAVIAIALALCLVLGSSLLDLQRANAALTNVDKQQTAAVAASHKSEDQLNALARGTRQLADGGNANAQAVVATLQRNGVHINPNAAGDAK